MTQPREITRKGAVVQEGQWYYVVLPFGWVVVGRWDGAREGLFGLWLEEAAFVVNAGTNHGDASHEGLSDGATLRRCGADGRMLINPSVAVWITTTKEPPYAGRAAR